MPKYVLQHKAGCTQAHEQTNKLGCVELPCEKVPITVYSSTIHYQGMSLQSVAVNFDIGSVQCILQPFACVLKTQELINMMLYAQGTAASQMHIGGSIFQYLSTPNISQEERG
jgi:hypothetical protein